MYCRLQGDGCRPDLDVWNKHVISYTSMNRYNLFFTLLLAVSAVLFTLGVIKKVRHLKEHSGADGGRKAVIAVIPKGTINMWWDVVRQGAVKAGEQYGVEIRWNGPEVETDREKQIQAVRDALVQNVDAVVLGPNDFKALVRPIEEVHEKGIPCVIIDSAADTDIYDAFAATDNIAGGADAARLLGKALNGRGEVLLIKYVPNSASTDGRAQGFRETIQKEFPNITILAEDYTDGTVEGARQKTGDLLTRFPQTTGVFAVNQPSAVGAYKAIQAHGQAGKVKYVGFDSDSLLVQAIEDGSCAGLIVQDPLQIGFIGVETAVKLLKGEKPPRDIPVPSMVVTLENLAEKKKTHAAALGL